MKFKNKMQNINDIPVEIKHGKNLGKTCSGFQQPYTAEQLHAYSAV